MGSLNDIPVWTKIMVICKYNVKLVRFLSVFRWVTVFGWGDLSCGSGSKSIRWYSGFKKCVDISQPYQVVPRFLQKSANNRERNVLTLLFLYLNCCMQDTAWGEKKYFQLKDQQGTFSFCGITWGREWRWSLIIRWLYEWAVRSFAFYIL